MTGMIPVQLIAAIIFATTLPFVRDGLRLGDLRVRLMEAELGSYLEAGSLADKAWSLFLPWIVLSASFAAIYARYMRSGLIEAMEEDYIRTARAKGLSERRVVMRHGVRSAMTPQSFHDASSSTT